MKKFLIIYLFVCMPILAQRPSSPTVVGGSTSTGAPIPLLVDSDGTLHTNTSVDFTGATVNVSISTAGLATSAIQTSGAQKTQIVDGSNVNFGTSTNPFTSASKTYDGSGNAITSSAAGSTRPFDVIIRDTSGTAITSFGLTGSLPSGTNVIGHVIVDSGGGVSSNFGSAFPTPGTAIGFLNSGGTTMAAGKVDANNYLYVNVKAIEASATGPVSGANADWVVPGSPDSGATTQVTVATSATQVIAADTARYGVSVTSIGGTHPMFCGYGSGVTATGSTGGDYMPAVDAYSIFFKSNSAVYCIATGGTQLVSVNVAK